MFCARQTSRTTPVLVCSTKTDSKHAGKTALHVERTGRVLRAETALLFETGTALHGGASRALQGVLVLGARSVGVV